VLQAKECTQTPSPSIIFFFGLAVEAIKEFKGASLQKHEEKKKIKVLFQLVVNLKYFQCEHVQWYVVNANELDDVEMVIELLKVCS
jgi:hypothetical protein